MRCTLLLMVMLLTLGGCKQNGSAFPLVEEQNQHFDDRLVGAWDTADEREQKAERPSQPLRITRHAAEGYRATLHDPKGKPLKFDLRLVDLGTDRFFQARRREVETDAATPGLGMHRFYLFGRYILTDEDLQIQFCSTKELEEKLKADDFPFIETEDAFLLTGSSEQLRQFLKEHADDLFPPSRPLRRIGSLPEVAAEQSDAKPSDPKQSHPKP